MKSIKFVGLDVHAETIAVAVDEQCGELRSSAHANAAASVKRPGVDEQRKFVQ